MLFVPRSLLRSYSGYQIIAADPQNLITAWRERSEGFWDKLSKFLPDKINFQSPELVGVIGSVGVEWQRTTQEKPERAQDIAQKAISWGFSQHKTIVKKSRRQGRYAFGIELQPTLDKRDVRPLQLPSSKTAPVKNIPQRALARHPRVTAWRH